MAGHVVGNRTSWAAPTEAEPFNIGEQSNGTGVQRRRPIKKFSSRPTSATAKSPARETEAFHQPPQQQFAFTFTAAAGTKATRIGKKPHKNEASTSLPIKVAGLRDDMQFKTDAMADSIEDLTLNDTATQQPLPQQQQQPFVFASQQPTGSGVGGVLNDGRTPSAPVRRSKFRARQPPVRSPAHIVPPSGAKLEQPAAAPTTSMPPLPQAAAFTHPPFDLAQIAVQKAEAAAAQYRNAGNEAFRQQQYKQAHEAYTKAAETVWPYPKLHPQLALLLCNRSATSLSLGCPLQALHDCNMGLQHDPTYAKCVLRKATCYVRLGNYAKAKSEVEKLSEAAKVDASLANEVTKKAQEITEVENRLLECLGALGHSVFSKAQGSQDLSTALTKLEAVKAHSPHSELVLAANAEALLRAKQYTHAEAAAHAPLHSEPGQDKPEALWRVWIIAQVAFHQGDAQATVHHLEKCLEMLGKQSSASFPAQTSEEDGVSLQAIIPVPPADDINEFLKELKECQGARTVGNCAMKSHSYKAALEAYNEAINASSSLSAAMTGLLHSNRAAAYQGLGEYSMALADCCRAKGLAPKYAKAYSRMASLLTEVQLHEAAAEELEAVLALPGVDASTRREYEKRLGETKRAAQRSSSSADYYKLLGIDKSETLEQIRKAYKKLALHMHPDKAARSAKFSLQLTSHGSVIVEAEDPHHRLKENATWLFKCLAEAHDVLTDESKRQKYDIESSSCENNASGGFYNNYYGGGGGGYSAYNTSAYNFGGAARPQHQSYSDYLRRQAAAAQQRRQQASYNARGGGYSDWSYWSYQ